ncbi:MAG: hypothetical protein LBQ50_01645 [Planctomycetaceae bacterium]|jgi:hypothetical protein|nr:hypothetical protein [Planctomycetaceae bacterium]
MNTDKSRAMSIGGFNPIMPSAAQDVKTHERTAESQERAAQAQGISGDDKESEASSGDRDADGRQAWRWTNRHTKHDDEKNHKVPDLSGKTGNSLDLSG